MESQYNPPCNLNTPEAALSKNVNSQIVILYSNMFYLTKKIKIDTIPPCNLNTLGDALSKNVNFQIVTVILYSNMFYLTKKLKIDIIPPVI